MSIVPLGVTPLGTKVDLGSGHIVLNGFPALHGSGTAPPLLVPLWTVPLLGGAATPSNTASPAPRFTSVSSRILIHLAVWPQ